MVSQQTIHKILTYCNTTEARSLLKEVVIYSCLEPQFIIDLIDEYAQLGNKGVQSKYLHAVFSFVEEVFQVTREELLGARRLRRITDARRVAMVLCYSGSALNKSAVARMFEKDHATILHAIKTHNQLIEVDATYNALVMNVVQMLEHAGYEPYKKTHTKNGTDNLHHGNAGLLTTGSATAETEVSTA